MIERPPIRHRREKVRSKIVSMVCFDSRRTDTLGAQVKSDVSKNILETIRFSFFDSMPTEWNGILEKEIACDEKCQGGLFGVIDVLQRSSRERVKEDLADAQRSEL